MGCECSLRTLYASRFGIGEVGQDGVRSCASKMLPWKKIRRISVIAMVISALLHTFCSKKIRYNMFQSSNTAADICLGSSVRFGLNKNILAQERGADLHSGKRRVTYHESEQKWILSLSLFLL